VRLARRVVDRELDIGEARQRLVGEHSGAVPVCRHRDGDPTARERSNEGLEARVQAVLSRPEADRAHRRRVDRPQDGLGVEAILAEGPVAVRAGKVAGVREADAERQRPTHRHLRATIWM
jgi:hypothetical protein